MDKHNTVGMDMGDKKNVYVVIDSEGELIERGTVANTKPDLVRVFGKMDSCVIAIEAGTHSSWVGRELESLGHRVLVGNPRKLRMIWKSDKKDDLRDAEMLGRIARLDPTLLHPIHHRSLSAQTDLSVLKGREMMVRTRTKLIAHIRGTTKSAGGRIPSCSPEVFHKRAPDQLPDGLGDILSPLFKCLETLHDQIAEMDRKIDVLCRDKYPKTERLRAVQGVGAITSLAFLLTLDDCTRLKKSRQVGTFLGLTPKRDQSGEVDKQLGITKAGNVYMRKLLVGSAQYILGPFAQDCDLRRAGLRIAERGGKNAKRRAVVAVARKLSVLLHKLWVSGTEYDPFFNEPERREQAA